VTHNDYLHEDTRKTIEKLNKKLEESLDNTNFILQGENGINLKFLVDLVDKDGINAMKEGDSMPMEEEYADMLDDEHPDEDEEFIDKYLNMELTMGVGRDDERQGQIIKCSRGIRGEPIGPADYKPFFNTKEYDIKFTDGMAEKYAANVIADNMYAQFDNEGNIAGNHGS
jgi:hypothetical protein